MKRLVLDASVVSKWFIEEEDTDKALQIRDLYLEGKVELASPVLILFELGNVLWRHPSITGGDSKKAFEAFLDLGIKLKSFAEADMLEKTFEISRELVITFYDAVYITQSTLQNAKFVTADMKLYGKIKGAIDASLLAEVSLQDLR